MISILKHYSFCHSSYFLPVPCGRFNVLNGRGSEVEENKDERAECEVPVTQTEEIRLRG